MTQRETALRLDEEWARARLDEQGRHAAGDDRERLLGELISTLRRLAGDDPECSARLGLRLGDLAGRRFAQGNRLAALTAIEEALVHSERAAAHSAEFARWHARALINHGVWLAWPLSDEARIPRHPLGSAGEEGPSAGEVAAGRRACDQTRAAVDVWLNLDQDDPTNRRGLAQAKVFMGDRLAELGANEEAIAWCVAAEDDFRSVLSSRSPGWEEAAEALDHIARQLRLRLHYVPRGGLERLRGEGRLPDRHLPQAVLAARIRGDAPARIAERFQLPDERVRAVLDTASWLAVWLFEVRAPDGTWTAQEHPWHSTATVTDRSAEDVGSELAEEFLRSPAAPGPDGQWRVRVWWQRRGDPAAALYRRTRSLSGIRPV
ncbi:hypothetical protein [Streptomyces sp. NPDC006879]|uniref:hypothetical protein n=1 Tax=Streptomyces sp. NPDC006879 TaxID=3364767 RepID=UPI0036AD9CE9